MSSILRLPAVDRSTLFFKKVGQQSTNVYTNGVLLGDQQDRAFEPPAKLPVLARLDTRSFIDMFDMSRFSTDNANEAICEAVPVHLASSSTDISPVTPKPATLQLHDMDQVRPTHVSELEGNFAFPTTSSDKALRESRRESTTTCSTESELSDTSSVPSRKSSKSSLFRSASERSSVASNKENHDRCGQTDPVTQRTQKKLMSFYGIPYHESDKNRVSNGKAKPLPLAPHYEGFILPQFSNHANTELATSHPISKRGARLGRAMSSGAQIQPLPALDTTEPVRQHHTSSGLKRSWTVSTKHIASLQFELSTTASQSQISSDAVTEVIFCILNSVHDINDLRSASMVNRVFYSTFQHHENKLVSKFLFSLSPAAWELRQITSYTENRNPFRLKCVNQDLATISAMQSFILMRCQHLCRADTIEGLMGTNEERKSHLEHALWRIWIFCKLFGKTSGREENLTKQIFWLNGGTRANKENTTSPFGVGNGKGLSMRQLEDISELWRCLETLISGFRGREVEARKAGVFDKCVINDACTEKDFLQAWIYDLLSLGPKAVLTLSSCNFEQARILGVTRWTPPSQLRKRANFLRAAVEDVYRERLVAEAKKKAADFKKTYKSSHHRSISDSAVSVPLMPLRPAPAPPAQALKVDTLKLEKQHRRLTAPVAEYTEIRPDCDPLATLSSNQRIPSTSPSTNPTSFFSLTMTPTASARLGATLFPVNYANPAQSPNTKDPVAAAVSSTDSATPEIVDPIDKALALLVNEMGFREAKAKRALAMCDSGSGVDVQRAIELLALDSKHEASLGSNNAIELPSHAKSVKFARQKDDNGYCEDSCKKVVTIMGKKSERPQGLGLVIRGLSSRKSFRKSAVPKLSVIADDDEERGGGGERTDVSLSHEAFRSSGGGNRSSMSPTPQSASDSSRPDAESRNSAIESTATCTSNSPSSVYSTSSPQLDNSYFSYGGASSAPSSATSTRPRVTLTRIGTGKIHRRTWMPSSLTKKSDEQGEIIGYTY